MGFRLWKARSLGLQFGPLVLLGALDATGRVESRYQDPRVKGPYWHPWFQTLGVRVWVVGCRCPPFIFQVKSFLGFDWFLVGRREDIYKGLYRHFTGS